LREALSSLNGPCKPGAVIAGDWSQIQIANKEEKLGIHH